MSHSAGMSKHAAPNPPDEAVALCAALPLPAGEAEAGVPEWIHLLPSGEIRTVDGRGPYRVADADGLVRVSMQGEARLPLDENHATDLAAPRGEPAPARGWITAMENRADGIWGRVEWTAPGRDLVASRAYRNISPAIAHRADGTVTAVLRASLVNRPNLRGLAALHQQQDDAMTLLERLRAELGLPVEAGEAAILDAVKAARGAVSTHAAALAPIATAAGLPAGADGAAVLLAVQALADPAKRVPADAVAALQAQLTGLQQTVSREKAEAFVDGAIREGRIAAPQAMRDHYVARHMADAAAVEKEIGAMPALHARRLVSGDPPPAGAAAGLDPTEAQVVALMGLDPAAYRKTKTADAEREGAL